MVCVCEGEDYTDDHHEIDAVAPSREREKRERERGERERERERASETAY